MKTRKTFIILSALTFLYGIYYWGIPSAININKNIDFVETLIHKKTGVSVNIEKPRIKMGLLPAIWFMAEDASIINKDGSKAAGIEHFALKINLLPILAGKLHIGNFSADKIYTNLIYTKNNELKLGQYSLPEKQESNITLNTAYIRIGNYNISLKDYKQNKNVLIAGDYLINEFKSNKHIKLETNAILSVDKKTSEIMTDIDIKLPLNKISENQFKINGHITNLDLKDFSPYVKAIPNSQIEALSGKINMLAGTIKDNKNQKKSFIKLSLQKPHIIYKDKDRSIYCDNNIDITTDINTIKNGIKISDLKIISKGINVLVNGVITKLNSSIPNIDMNVKIDNSRTENFIPLLPGEENLSPDVNFLVLKKNPFYGDINGELQIKGKADIPDLYGKIAVTKGYLNAPLPYNTPLADITLDFSGTNMYMDIKVPAPINQMVYVKGVSDIYKDDCDLHITSTETVDLKTAQIVLNPLHEILKFELGPVPIMDIKGIGNIDLRVTGSREEPHAYGQFNFKNTTASFLDIHNMELTNGEGSLDFDDINAHFYTKKALMYGHPISVDGTCSLYGDLNFLAQTKNQNLADLLKIIQSSPMLTDIQQIIKPIKAGNGKTDLSLNLTGKVKDIRDIVFNKNIFAKGLINLNGANINVENINISNIYGDINFNNLIANFDLNSKLDHSDLHIKGKFDNNDADVRIISNKFVLKDGLKIINQKLPEDLDKITTSFDSYYKGNINKINPNGLNIKGKIYAFKGKNFSINNTDFNIKNGNAKISHIKGAYKSSLYDMTFSVNNILTDKQSIDGSFNVQNFDLKNLNNVIPVKNPSGIISIKGQIKNNDIYADTQLNDIGFEYAPINVKIKHGRAQIKKDALILSKIQAYAEDMPLYLDGKIGNILNKNPNLNLNIYAKPTQNFIDDAYNKDSLYPLKIKGNIGVTSNIDGTLNALHNKTKLIIGSNSSIYYMGATIGNIPTDNSVSNSVRINIDNILYPHGIQINNLEYNNVTQNGKVIPQLNASGYIELLKNNDIKFNNFKIKTQKPTDAKIFNIVFRKPLIKEGVFSSDLIINGRASQPYPIGKFYITDINIPIFDANISDIDLDFKKDKIFLNSKGKILTSNLTSSAIIRNKLVSPIILDDMNIHFEALDLNKLTDLLMDFDVNNVKTYSIPNTTLPDFSGIIIKKSKITADNIKIKELQASNFVANGKLNEKMQLEVPNFHFNVAEGIISGSIKYNLLNHATNISAKVADANAQIITEKLTDLKGQLYGNVVGSININCNGSSQDACIQTLSGSGNFQISNGKMPKLGSLEYLLNAGNLVKSGITGLSIKGITELITPYRTGEFESIKGSFKIENGIANSIKIYSSGKALNIFIKGAYNLNNQIADMEIFGALTNNFKNILGKISSASLNTLFNTIPGINISDTPSILTNDIQQIPNVENAIRMFNAIIYGDINGDNYVKSFKWLK